MGIFQWTNIWFYWLMLSARMFEITTTWVWWYVESLRFLYYKGDVLRCSHLIRNYDAGEIPVMGLKTTILVLRRKKSYLHISISVQVLVLILWSWLGSWSCTLVLRVWSWSWVEYSIFCGCCWKTTKGCTVWWLLSGVTRLVFWRHQVKHSYHCCID